MTFANAVSMLNDGRAAKRSSWGGYVYRTDTAQSTDGSYSLTFKNRTGTEYAYSYNGTTGAWTAPSTKVPFDSDIMASMIANDWTTGKKTDFETARAGGGIW